MKILFVGPPGCGKGTQAKIISKILGIPHISTGDLVRETTGDLKRRVDSYIGIGNLIPDNLMLEILQRRLSNSDTQNGFILDGYPRNIAQAEQFGTISSFDRIILINISDNEALRRISGRRYCPKCGRIYNFYTEPKPWQEGLCDDDGSLLHERNDQREEVIQQRLKIYHSETEPILKKYNFVTIDGNGDIKTVTKQILASLTK